MTPRVQAFHALHQAGCFVLPNPWDVGSARLLEQAGFKAVATTSAGFAWTLGRPDNGATLDEVLAHLGAISGSVAIPVNADFEGGFAVEPKAVAAHVARAVATGIAGLSIEDSTGDAAEPLFEFSLAVERVRAARGAIDASGTGVLLTARCESYLVGRPDRDATIGRLVAFSAAGADCLYAPGLASLDDIRAVVRAVRPKPVNVLAGAALGTVAQLAEAGARRISVGGALARTALSGFLDAAREIAERGTFTRLGTAVPFGTLNAAFAKPSR